MTTAATIAPGWWVVVTGLFAITVSALTFVEMATGQRHVLRHANVLGTLIHEAGRAVTSCLTGGGVYSLQIQSPHSGVTQTWFYSRFSAITTTVAGYAMPPLAGLGTAWLLHHGKAAAVLTVTVVAAVGLLLVTRDWITLVCVLAMGPSSGGDNPRYKASVAHPGTKQRRVADSFNRDAELLPASEGGPALRIADVLISGHVDVKRAHSTLHVSIDLQGPVDYLGTLPGDAVAIENGVGANHWPPIRSLPVEQAVLLALISAA